MGQPSGDGAMHITTSLPTPLSLKSLANLIVFLSHLDFILNFFNFG
jgi:hypothetical protein